MHIFTYLWMNIRIKILNKKILLFFAMIITISWRDTDPIRQMSISVDYPVSGCLFPFLICSFTFLVFFWFGVIFVNSDAPFMQVINMYHMVRTGRKVWAAGQLLGIIFRAFLLTAGTAICAMLPVLFRLDVSSGWGRFLHTAAMTNAQELYGFEYIIYYESLVRFTPLGLMFLSILVTSLVASFIGILMFLLGLYAGRGISIAVVTGLALALFPVINMAAQVRQKLAFFVPTIWPEVARIFVPEYGYYWMPSIHYILFFLLIGIFVMAGLILWKVERAEFQWENEEV